MIMPVAQKQKGKSQLANGRYSSPTLSSQPAPIIQKLAYARRFLVYTLLFTGIIIAFWLGRQPIQEIWPLLSDQERVSAYLQSFGAWGPLALAVVQFLQVMIVVIPGHVFLIAAGYVYGLLPGFVMNLTYVVTASQIAFLLARWAGRPLVERLVSQETLNRWYKIGEERGFVFFTIAFLLPVFPTDLMNFIAGLTGISATRFLAANFLGRLPSVIMLTLIGSHGLELSSLAWGVMGAIVATLYVAGRYVIIKIERRYKVHRNVLAPSANSEPALNEAEEEADTDN
jgi:uncharacterized membrane protein YdjX (TVP38/TMEM64 family)